MGKINSEKLEHEIFRVIGLYDNVRYITLCTCKNP